MSRYELSVAGETRKACFNKENGNCRYWPPRILAEALAQEEE
jgi:hypothetical protein